MLPKTPVLGDPMLLASAVTCTRVHMSKHIHATKNKRNPYGKKLEQSNECYKHKYMLNIFMNSTHVSKTLDLLIKIVLVTILVAMTKPMKKETRKEGFILAHSLRVLSVMAGKAWPQEHEVACHSASAGRNQSG